ncbi:MAG: amidohydrolase, partial [Pseudomonadota bacterium]
MVEEGLFEKFPCESVYGMHNWPGMDTGHFAVRTGPMMAAFDIFEITVAGKGGHGAMPHMAVDPIVVASELVGALQTIASRNTHPLDAVVCTVTQFHAGDTWNVIPGEVVLRGTTRSFRPEVQDSIEPAMRRIAGGVCAAHGASFEMTYERRYPPTINTKAETEICRQVAAQVAGGDEYVHGDLLPSMGSEDFAFMLQKKPGCYIWIGNGPGEGGCMLHNSHYDFADEILPLGATYWVRLAETILAPEAA